MRNMGCACAPVCSHAAEGSVLVAVYAAAYLKALATWKAVLQLWQQRCSCGSNYESCYGVGYVQFPPTVKAEGVTYMVLIGGGLHCRAAAALPEALLPSAGVTDCDVVQLLQVCSKLFQAYDMYIHMGDESRGGHVL